MLASRIAVIVGVQVLGILPGPAVAVAEPGAAVLGVVLAADGNGLITWETAGDKPRVWARAWSSSPTAAPGPIFLVSPGLDGGYDAQVAMNARGDAVISWSTDHQRSSIDRQARVRSRTGSWGAVHHLRVGNVNNATAIAGDASAFFAGFDDLDPESPILVRALSRSDRLSPLRVLQRSNDHRVKVDIAADDRGNALLVWRRYVGGLSRVVARSLSGAGKLGRQARISSPTRAQAGRHVRRGAAALHRRVRAPVRARGRGERRRSRPVGAGRPVTGEPA